MDSNDRKELSAADLRRQHIKEHGSFLCCPDRDTLCVHMEGCWGKRKCDREQCILDDPKYIREQEQIEENRKAAAREEKMNRKKEEAAQIRDQRNRIKSYEQIEIDAIRRLEEKSRQAFYNNKPQLGHTLFNRAQFRRQELKKHMDQRRGKTAPPPGAKA